MMILDFDEESNLVHGVGLNLQPRQVFELMEALEGHVSKLIREKACVTCVNYDDMCKLPATQRLECNKNGKSLYAPAYPTA